MRLGRTRRDGRIGISRMGRIGFIKTLLIMLVVGVLPASATITGASPGSATRHPNSSVSVNVTTDIVGGSVAVNGSAPGVVVGKTGSAPTFTFTFQILDSAVPGKYQYTFTDGESLGSFTLTVEAPPPTTTTSTTTTQPPTTTTRAPTTTTTTEPPPETTTTSSTTTTTVPPTTTTVPPTTTTTVPPTTTTSTLIPAGIAAPDDGDTDSSIPLTWLGGGFALLALAIVAALIYARRRPAYGSAAPGFLVAWRHRSQKRRAAALSRPSRSAGIGSWWRTSGPLVSYQEWRGGRNAARDLQRKIEERRRLGGK